MLFNGSNLTAGADGFQWNGGERHLANHFVPFTEAQIGATGRIENDFLVQYMSRLTFSPEAKEVLSEGLKLWAQFHATRFPRKIRDKFKLGRPDAGWYQIRLSLEANGENQLTDFNQMNAAYSALTKKLRPLVYSLGFLPE